MRRRVRLGGELSDLDMNKTFKSVTKAHSNRRSWRRRDRKMSKELVLGRGASLAVLRQTSADVHRSPDLDSNEVGPGRVWTRTIGTHTRTGKVLPQHIPASSRA